MIPYIKEDSYLNLYKRLGLRDPRDFFFESAVRNCSGCNQTNNLEYRRQTGKSTETLVWAIHQALNKREVCITYLSPNSASIKYRELMSHLNVLGIGFSNLHDRQFTLRADQGILGSISLRTASTGTWNYIGWHAETIFVFDD